MFIPHHKENRVFLMILPFFSQSRREDNKLPKGAMRCEAPHEPPTTPITSISIRISHWT